MSKLVKLLNLGHNLSFAILVERLKRVTYDVKRRVNICRLNYVQISYNFTFRLVIKNIMNYGRIPTAQRTLVEDKFVRLCYMYICKLYSWSVTIYFIYMYLIFESCSLESCFDTRVFNCSINCDVICTNLVIIFKPDFERNLYDYKLHIIVTGSLEGIFVSTNGQRK